MIHVKHVIKYINYILKHKWYVFLECCKLGILWQGITHDLSKFSRKEFIPYMKKYTIGLKDEKTDSDFCEAWHHHIAKNPHHWEHWTYLEVSETPNGEQDKENIAIKMPKRYVKEMLADWRAMSKTFGQKTIIEWYEKNITKMVLHNETLQELYKLFTIEEVSEIMKNKC